MLTIPIKRNLNIQKLPLALAGAYLAVAAVYLYDYFIVGLTEMMGIMLLPYLLFIKPGKFSIRYFLPAIIFTVLAVMIPVKTTLFLALFFGLLFLAEISLGKISYYVLFLVFILSPVFRYLSNLLGFPIRLWLSEISGNILQATGQQVTVSGNLITLNGAAFSVDPACTGLKMMTVSFLLALFVIAFYQRKSQHTIHILLISGLLLLTFLLNVTANLFRIILLILFKIPPGNIFHDLVGMACLIIYVVVPIIILTAWMHRKKTVPKIDQKLSPSQKKYWALPVSFLLFLATVFSAQKSPEFKAQTAALNELKTLPGYHKTMLREGILKFENPETLIYVKPVHFYAAEHNPAICWTGSGYEFSHIEKRDIDGFEIYTGVIQKGKDTLYTAWWFDQGKIKTISHLEWRWQALKTNQGFNLINVSAANPEMLNRQLKFLLQNQIFRK